MGFLDIFRRKKGTEVTGMMVPDTPLGGRKGHKGEFVKAVERRRVRNKIAKMSRKANR